jgi:cell division protein FtsL
MTEKEKNILILRSILKILLRLLVPVILFFLIIWQGIHHAKVNREIKKLTQKKEDLYKRNYDLKAKIISTYAADRVENLYNQKYNPGNSYSKERVINLTLPQEKISTKIDE